MKGIQMTSPGGSASMIQTFGGIDKNARIAESSFAEMENMTGADYPLLSSRAPRKNVMESLSVYDMLRVRVAVGSAILDGFAVVTVVRNETVVNNETVVSNETVIKFVGEDGTALSPDSGTTTRTDVSIGGGAGATRLVTKAGYLYAFPQAVRINLLDASGTAEALGATATLTPGTGSTVTVKIEPCDEQGTVPRHLGHRMQIIYWRGVYGSVTKQYRSENFALVVPYAHRNKTMTATSDGITYFFGADRKLRRVMNDTGSVTGSVSFSGMLEGWFAITASGTSKDMLASFGLPTTNTDTQNGQTYDWYASLSGEVIDGYKYYNVIFRSESEGVPTEKPTNPVSGQVWYDEGTGSYYIYSDASGSWESYAVSYTRMSADVSEWSANFAENDAVTISGISDTADGTYVIRGKNGDDLVLDGVTAPDVAVLSEGESVTVERRVPTMDFVVEQGNRLWGCYYGKSGDKVINEIYASALGDATNWYRYQGISTDSWTATVGADGVFTGAAVYGGHPVFFKEDTILRLYGTSPSSFQISEAAYRGVEEGSDRSLATADGVLYYLSRDGYMAYTGGVPKKADAALGNEVLKNAVGGALRGKYVTSVQDEHDTHHLYVYDTRRGLWHREDDTNAVSITPGAETLYVVKSDHSVFATDGGDEVVKWYAETGEWGLDDPYRKYIGAIILRATIPIGAHMSVAFSYDDGEWRYAGTFVGAGTRPATIRLIPQRCDRFRMRIAGEGNVSLYSVYREIKSTNG